MKVYEVIEKLSKAPAGNEFEVSVRANINQVHKLLEGNEIILEGQITDIDASFGKDQVLIVICDKYRI